MASIVAKLLSFADRKADRDQDPDMAALRCKAKLAIAARARAADELVREIARIVEDEAVLARRTAHLTVAKHQQ